MKTAPEKKTAIFYVRCRKDSKAWLYAQRKSGKWKSMAEYFDALVDDLKGKTSARKKK